METQHWIFTGLGLAAAAGVFYEWFVWYRAKHIAAQAEFD